MGTAHLGVLTPCLLGTKKLEILPNTGHHVNAIADVSTSKDNVDVPADAYHAQDAEALLDLDVAGTPKQ